MARNVDGVIAFFSLVALKCLTHAHLKQRIHPRVGKKIIGMEDLPSYNHRYVISTMEQLRGCCKLSRHQQLSVTHHFHGIYHLLFTRLAAKHDNAGHPGYKLVYTPHHL